MVRNKGRAKRTVLVGAAVVIAIALVLGGFAGTSNRDPLREDFERIARAHGLERVDPRSLNVADWGTYNAPHIAFAVNGATLVEEASFIEDLQGLAPALPDGGRHISRSATLHGTELDFASPRGEEEWNVHMTSRTDSTGKTRIVATYSHTRTGLLERIRRWWDD